MVVKGDDAGKCRPIRPQLAEAGFQLRSELAFGVSGLEALDLLLDGLAGNLAGPGDGIKFGCILADP